MAENASEKPVQGGHASAAEEKKKKLNGGVDNAFMDMVSKGNIWPWICKEGDEIVHHVKQEIFNDSKLLSSLVKNDSQSIKQEAMDEDDGRFRAAKVEMDEAIAENERLKQLLSRIVKQYQTLQTHFFQVLKQEEAKKSAKPVPARQEISSEEPELFSLSLGRNTTTSESKNDEKKGNNLSDDHGKELNELNNEGLSLGLDCKFEPESSITTKNPSSENSVGEDQKEEEPTEMSWPPSKVLKTMKGTAADDSQLKKTRVSVRARCETPTMNDGCQWRKYGQKISKGNPCPRAYYRCTVSPNCPVRKQVQRCVQDMSILVTTYEGTHNHHLPLSATAMASTTSAAASVLQSQSSTSQPGLGISSSVSAPSSISTSTFNGLSFSSLSHNAKPHQFYFPNSSVSTSNSHPTITLDLTGENTNTGHFSRFPYGPRYSTSTCLNFSSSSCTSLEANTTLHWNNNAAYSTYGSTVLPHSRNHVASLNSIMGRQILQEHSYQPPYMQMNNQQTTAPSQQALTETIAAATKVIASNPTFQSALAAALTSSFVGNNGGTNGARDVNPFRPEDHSAGLNLMMKLDNEPFTFNPRYPRENTNTGAVGFASSYLSKASALNQEQGSLALFPTSLPLSMHGSSATDDQSPASGRDHGK